MVCLPDVSMPNNCHECDIIGLSDVVGLACPCAANKELYNYDARPKECPLKEEKPVLDQNETAAFVKNMIHPNDEALRRRDAFLNDIIIRVSGEEIVAEGDSIRISLQSRRLIKTKGDAK